MLTRRTLVTASLPLLTLTTLAACGPNMAGSSGSDPGTVRFAWWGNPTRDELTRAAIDAYAEVAQDITVAAEPGEWDGYWDKLATQVAGGDCPDVLQMDESYLAEYASRGILLDLADADLDTSAFDPAALDTGRVEDGLFALNAGINAPVLLANPEVFEAAGMDLPDDTTWTWDVLVDIATRLTDATDEGTYGVQQFGTAGGPPLFVFLRQLGAERFSAEGGLGYAAEDLQQWMELVLRLQETGAAPSASEAVEDAARSLDQSLFAVGRCGMQAQWSNQAVTFDSSLGGTVEILRMPSMSGSAADAELWYKASMYFAVAAGSPNAEAAAAFVDWMVNSPEGGTTLLAERGVPANLDVREAVLPELVDSDRKSVDFIEAIADELGDPPPITPPGGGAVDDALARHIEDVLFGRADPATASAAMVDEAAGLLG